MTFFLTAVSGIQMELLQFCIKTAEGRQDEKNQEIFRFLSIFSPTPGKSPLTLTPAALHDDQIRILRKSKDSLAQHITQADSIKINPQKTNA